MKASEMKVYGLKTCSTCRRAIKALNDSGYETEMVDVRKDGMPAEVLERLYAVFGDQLLNRRATTWRKLPDADKKKPAVRLMLEHPLLIKRPVIEEQGGLLTIGWGKDQQKMWAEKEGWFGKGVGTAQAST
jgi:arsenate reductase